MTTPAGLDPGPAPAAVTGSGAKPPAPRPSPNPPVLDDATRQRNLDRMKRRATGLLVLAAAVFVATSYWEAAYPWLGYVRATAEAAVIGGLADWFAVTALFKHPLGIPIPHTAIVPAKKDRLGRTLGNFVQNHFLAREVLAERLRHLKLAERAARWLADPSHSHLIATQLKAGLGRALEALPEKEIHEMIRGGLAERVRATQVAPILGNVLTVVRSGNRHQDLLTEAVRLAAQTIDQSRESIRDRIKAESPWWVPGIVDDKIYRKIVTAIETLLKNIAGDPAHPLRAKFDVAIERFIGQLESSPQAIARAEALKEQLLADPVIDEFATWLWHDLKKAALGERGDGSEARPGGLERGVVSFANSLLGNQEMLDRLDDVVVERTLAAVEQYRGEVSDLIAHTVARWDPKVTSYRIELAIGRDLQFIRINGTLVGGLLGLLIYTIERLAR